MQRYTFLALLSALLVLTTFSACKKDNNDPGKVVLEFDHVWDGAAFNLNTAYTTAQGESVTPTLFRYYVSNIVLTKSDGSTWAEPESYRLIDEAVASSQTFTLDNVPAGDYTKITFLLGVDSTRNVSGAQTGALDPSNAMFWSWNSGYIFFKFEGQSLVSMDSSVVYHIGGFRTPNIAYRTIEMPISGEAMHVDNEHSPQAHIMVDVKNTFSGAHALSFATMAHCHMPGANAVKVADNLARIFTLDHIHQH